MVGGGRINYPFDISTPIVDLATIKLQWNLVLSTPGAEFFTLDVANFYLGTPMERPELMRLPLNIIPQKIVDQYKLKQKTMGGWVYVHINDAATEPHSEPLAEVGSQRGGSHHLTSLSAQQGGAVVAGRIRPGVVELEAADAAG